MLTRAAVQDADWKDGTMSSKGADYSAGSQNIQCAVQQPSQSGANLKIDKAMSSYSYGAGAMNIEAQSNVPKVKENLGYGKSKLVGQSSYGADAVNL